jgi:hypothetical protein
MSRTWFINQRENVSEEELFKLSTLNMTNYLNFSKVDIAITTPTQLDMLSKYSRIKNLNPKYIVIDEADYLLEGNINHSKALRTFLIQMNYKSQEFKTNRKVI